MGQDRTTIDPEPAAPEQDTVEEASVESFPASDPPAYTPTPALGPPPAQAADLEAIDRLPEEVREHPISNPTSRPVEP